MSTQLLHLDSSILGTNSVSRSLSAAVVDKITRGNPALVVTHRDLAATPIAHLSGAYLGAASGQAPADDSMRADVALGGVVLAEFLAANIVVIGLGFYNFGIPSQLKAWVDRIVIAGKTFKYTETGAVVGLAGGKRIILVIARGGFYGPGTPTESFEHAETYLRNVFGFIGNPQIEVVSAEGMAVGPEVRQAGIAQANAKIAQLSA